MRALAAIVSLILVGILAVPYGTAYPQSDRRRVSISISKYPTDTEMAAWTAYGVSLGAFVEKSGIATAAPEGPYIPTYEAELESRQRQLKIWRELNEKARYSLKYMDEMQNVETAGFLREYIWRHHARPTWGTPPTDLRTEAFLQWATENLAGHTPQTGARIVFGPQTE